MNLYELKGAYKLLQDQIDAGEDFSEALGIIEDAIEEKADSYAKVMLNMDASITAVDNEIKRLNEKKKYLNASKDKLKSTLFEAMKETGKEKFKTDLFSFAIVKNGGKAPLVLDVGNAMIPDRFKVYTESIDKDALRKYIEETGDLTYAHLEPRGESLRIK